MAKSPTDTFSYNPHMLTLTTNTSLTSLPAPPLRAPSRPPPSGLHQPSASLTAPAAVSGPAALAETAGPHRLAPAAAAGPAERRADG